MRTSFSDQVEQRKQIDPDKVDEVPVERHDVDGSPELLAEVASVVPDPYPDEDADTHEDVDAVHPGHHEIDGEERVRVLRQRRRVRHEVLEVRMVEPPWQQTALELVLVFEELDQEEHERAADGDEDQPAGRL